MNQPLPRIQISNDHRSLVLNDGRPFFFLGDTAWELFHRLTREEIGHYLAVRAEQQFNVIQAVALAEFDGLTIPNREGHLPLQDLDPARPNDAYFQLVDWTIDRANALGMYVGLLPTWGDKVNRLQGAGPEVFTPANARVYGRWLAERYAERGIIWILGGDRPLQSPVHQETYRAMAEGISQIDQNHLITFHPNGNASSSNYVHAEPWLDFNMIQSGHSIGNAGNWTLLQRDRGLHPTKPTLDAEPCYEDHPIMGPEWKPTENWFDGYDVRKAAYRAVFSGAAGHTYGCHDIWQFFDLARNPAVNCARTPWRKALHLPGAGQMRHLRHLIESANMLGAEPIRVGQTQAADDAFTLINRATQCTMIYLPSQKTSLAEIKSDSTRRTFWFNPSDGSKHYPDASHPWQRPDALQPDWVLVIE